MHCLFLKISAFQSNIRRAWSLIFDTQGAVGIRQKEKKKIESIRQYEFIPGGGQGTNIFFSPPLKGEHQTLVQSPWLGCSSHPMISFFLSSWGCLPPPPPLLLPHFHTSRPGVTLQQWVRLHWGQKSQEVKQYHPEGWKKTPGCSAIASDIF